MCQACADKVVEYDRQRRARKAAADRKPRLTAQERKHLGICRDCEEEVGGGSTIFCKVHNARMREYRKKHKAKKRAEAKEAKAEKES